MVWPVDPSRYLAFLGVMTAMAFFPGPANLFSAATGMARGRRATLGVVAGMNSATLVWYAAAAVGLSAVLTALPWLFQLLRWAGAAYLLWLGIGAVRSALHPDAVAPAAITPRPGSNLRNGFMVQIANPKVVLFFTAVLPPFVDLARPIVPQLVLLGAATILMDVIAMTTYGLSGAALSRRMDSPRFRRGFSWTSAGLLIGAAALVAISG